MRRGNVPSITKQLSKCTVVQIKKGNTPIYFNTNYLTEMKLVPIVMGYCLLQFNALKFFLGVLLHGESLPNFNFFNVNSQIFQRNRKVHLSNCLETNFHDIPNISLRDIRRSGSKTPCIYMQRKMQWRCFFKDP